MNKFSLILLIGACWLYSTSAGALSCGPPDLERSFDSNDVVIIAEVVEVEDEASVPKNSKIPRKMGELDRFKKYGLKVLENLKGEFSESAPVYKSSYWGDYFLKGQKVVLFLKQYDGEYLVPLCSGSGGFKGLQSPKLEELRKFSLTRGIKE